MYVVFHNIEESMKTATILPKNKTIHKATNSKLKDMVRWYNKLLKGCNL